MIGITTLAVKMMSRHGVIARLPELNDPAQDRTFLRAFQRALDTHDREKIGGKIKAWPRRGSVRWCAAKNAEYASATARGSAGSAPLPPTPPARTNGSAPDREPPRKPDRTSWPRRLQLFPQLPVIDRRERRREADNQSDKRPKGSAERKCRKLAEL